LHPARAKMLGPEEKLGAYRWSSLRFYLQPRRKRPVWLRVDRLLGEHGIGKDNAEGRLEFERRMEARRWAEVSEETLKGLRRGWCFGSAEFRRRMLEEIQSGEEASLGGGLRQKTAIAKGERIVAEELKRLRWTEEDLRRCRKSDPEKLRIAARLRRVTILSLKDIATRVGLGSSKSANAKLDTWMQADQKPGGVGAESTPPKRVMPRKRTKLIRLKNPSGEKTTLKNTTKSVQPLNKNLL